MSKLLRVEQGHDEVAEEKHSNEQNDKSCQVHRLSQLFAGGDVEKSGHEEGDGEDNHEEV
jgi:hypothetical protein